MAAAPPDGHDPARIRELLADAQGYAVFGREGKRVGLFIELAEPDSEQIAIRQDGIVLWRRRLLPITAVAGVFPDRRAVALNVDRSKVSETAAESRDAEPTTVPAEQDPDVDGNVHDRIARYVAAGEGAADQTTRDSGRGKGGNAAGHLLFVSTPRGYTLVELAGTPPPVGRRVEVPGQEGAFLVNKLGPSPLPGDRRTCAYLEPADPSEG